MTEAPPQPQVHKQQLAGLTKLLAVTRGLAALHRLDDVLQAVTAGACEALSCERASLYLYDEENRELFTRVVTELEIEEIRSTIDDGITGWVARRRKIANIPDPQLDARWNSAIDRQTGFQTRNILAAPLISQHEDRLVGVLQLLNRKQGEFNPFDEQLIEAFASHAATALERSELLEEVRRSQELKVAVDVGRKIQSSFLPDEVASIPGYDVAAWWEPAEQVSGDYYDLFPLPDDRHGLVVADVSGHGVGASLIMASVRAMLRVMSRTESDPFEIVSRLAETTFADLREERFITLLMVALDPRSHTLEFANAGHGPAFVYRGGTGDFEELKATTLPLGFLEEPPPEPARRLTLEEGDILLLATDGTIERRNDRHELFGQPRLCQIVRDLADASAARIVEAVKTALRDFAPTGPPPDDMTLVIAKRC